MLLRTKKSLLGLLALICVMLFAVVGALSYTQNDKTAYATVTNNETIDFGSDGITLDDKAAFDELITLLGASSYDDLSSKLTAPKKASEFASAKTVTLGGVAFNIMYVSKADYTANGTTAGDVIVTLWMAENDSKNPITSQYSYPNGIDNTSVAYPTHMYSSSYIRSTLVGTDYLKVAGEQTLSGTDGAVNDAWRPFNVGGAIYKYLATPANMAWQETLSAVDIINNGVMYNYLNEAWGTPSEGSFLFFKGYYNFDYSEKTGYFDWKNDRIWLPAATEVCSNTLWDTSSTQRENTAATWLRSGKDDNANKAYHLNVTGVVANAVTNSTHSVRPALHLNLKSIDEAANPKPYEVTVGATTTKYVTFEEAWNAAGSAGTATVKMFADAEVSSTLEVSKNKDITLDLNGKKLTYTGESGSVVKISGTFTLNDGGTGSHEITSPVTDKTVTVSGGLITGGKGNASSLVIGGAVYVTGTGKFTMTGGTLAGNTAGMGGGVYNSGTLTMTGGRITCNTAGGGVYGGGVYNNGTFKVSGTPEIRGNTANGSECNVTLINKITVAGELTEGAEIGVGSGIVVTGYTQSDKPGKYFIPDDPANDCVYAKDGNVTIGKHAGGTATCANKAVCVNCDEEYGEAIAHSYGEWETTLAPTCSATGSKKHTCAVCNHEETEEIAINETAHDWNDGEITTQPTCTATGVKTYTCTHNSEHTKTEDIAVDANAHSFATAWSSDATGHWHAATCTHTTEKSGFAAHTAGDWIVDTVAQIGVVGSKHKECTVCGYTTETAEIPVLPVPHTHTFATEWSKDKSGHWHAATCEHTSEKSNFAAHTAGDWIVDTPSQIGVVGSKHKECTVCGYTTESEAVPALKEELVKPDGNGGENKVVVTTPSGFTSDIELVVTEIEKENYGAYQTIAETVNGEIDLVYDITLKSEGVTIQPDGTLTIKLLIPTDLRGKGFKLFHLHGNEATDMEYTVDGNYVVVNTDRLSEFIFVGEKTIAPASNVGNGLSAGAIAGITIGVILLVLLVAYIALYFALYLKGVLKGKAFNIIYVPMNAIFNKKDKA